MDSPRELTLITGEGDNAELREVKQDLAILSKVQGIRSPTKLFFACKQYRGPYFDFLPMNHKFFSLNATAYSTFILPKKYSNLIFESEFPNTTALLNDFLRLCWEEYQEERELRGNPRPRIGRYRQQNSDEVLEVDLDFAEKLEPMMALIQSIEFIRQRSDVAVFPVATQSSTNSISQEWFVNLRQKMMNGEMNIERDLFHPSGLCDLRLESYLSIPQPPLNYPRAQFMGLDEQSDEIFVPRTIARARPIENITYPELQEYVPHPHPNMDAHRRAQLAKRAHASLNPSINNGSKSKATQRREEFQERERVIHPEIEVETVTNNSDDESLFSDEEPTSPERKRTKLDENESRLEDHHPGNSYQVPTATDDGSRTRDWRRKYRADTPVDPQDDPRSVVGMPIDDESINIPTYHRNHEYAQSFRDQNYSYPNRYFHTKNHSNWGNWGPKYQYAAQQLPYHNNSIRRPGTPRRSTNRQAYPRYPNNNAGRAFNTNNTCINNRGTSNNYFQSMDPLVSTLKDIVELNVNVAERQLEQRERHHQEKADKDISEAAIQQHLNASTIDGINPAYALQERDRAYMTAKSKVDTKAMIDSDLRAEGCQVESTLSFAGAAFTGRWCSTPRWKIEGAHIFGLPTSHRGTHLDGIDIEQAWHSYSNNRDISNRERNALTKPSLVPPKTIHFLVEQLRSTTKFYMKTTGSNSKLHKALDHWLTWVEINRQELIELQRDGHKDLPAQIAYQIFVIVNNYLAASVTGVPNANILESEEIQRQILNGNFHIVLPPTISDQLNPNSRRNNNSTNRNTSNHTQAANRASNINGNPSSIRPQGVSFTNQPQALRTSHQDYTRKIAPAIANRLFTIPQHNGLGECLKWALLGNCREGCFRSSNHTPIASNSARERELVTYRNQCFAAANQGFR